MSGNFIELKDVSKYYHSNQNVNLGLRKINLSLNKGEFVAVTGESGSGKTTLMNVISGVDTYEEGELYYKGEQTSCYTLAEWDKYRKDNISFIYQDYNLIDSYTILQNVELAFLDSNLSKTDRRKKALLLIEQVGLTSHIKHKCTKLSGGQKQRVAIARALAKDTPILIADEPTGNLDETTSKSIIKLLAEVSKTKLLIMVTHSYEDVASYATRKIRLFDGAIAEDKQVTDTAVPVIEEKLEVSAENITVKTKIRKKFQNFRNISRLASRNLIATPKKSLFMLSTVFIAALLYILYFFIASGATILPPETNSQGYRKDTAIVFKSDRSELTEATREEIISLDGIDAIMLNSELETITTDSNITNSYYNTFSILNIECNDNDWLRYGSIPVNDNEILIGIEYYDKPDLSFIGKEVVFYITINKENGSTRNYSNDDDDEVRIEKTFIITGFTSSGFSYITTEAIEDLSLRTRQEVSKYKVHNITINDEKTDTDTVCGFKISDVVVDSTIQGNDAVLVFNSEAIYTTDKSLYKIYEYFMKDNIGEIKYSIDNNNSSGYSYDSIINMYDINISTQDTNSDMYNQYYEGGILLILNSSYINLNSDNILKSNSATVIMDEKYNADNVINTIEKAGYKVIYNYNIINSGWTLENDLQMKIIFTLIGILVLMLGIFLLSLIFSRVMKSKKKDYNILRTLGISSNNIKLLTLLEILFINLVAFLLVSVIFIAFFYICLATKSFGVIYFLKSLLPYGLIHYSTLFVFLITLLSILIEAFFVGKFYNWKLFKKSIKSSAFAD